MKLGVNKEQQEGDNKCKNLMCEVKSGKLWDIKASENWEQQKL